MHRRPWTIATQARDMARLHARLARFRIPGLPDIKTRLHREIADHVGLPTQSAHSRQHAWEMLDALPCGDALLHGDFHPGNVMRCPQGLMAIDWGDAARGDPCADVATTLLLMAVGNLPASGGIDALVLRLGRRHALSSYRQARLQIGDVEPRAIARWLHLMALLREWYPAPSDNLRLVRHLAGSMAACARLAGVRW
jgi:streptomycin 6-kinase